jgi:predicted PolB exonuclease-like 3'-5' exonuclease
MAFMGDVMLRNIPSEVWAFDVEWVPDVESGRRAYGLAPDADDETVLDEMWQRGGATDDDPRPYLKTVLCRVVSVAAVIRKRAQDGSVSLVLHSVPSADAEAMHEADLLARFLEAVGKAKPQLVGFNSRSSDLMILLQRAMVHRLTQPEFCRRPAKPWEGTDYFARGGEAHIDLMEGFGGRGKATPSLHEFATACRIPGKIATDGSQVTDLWLGRNVRRIVQYNECDALTTYLLWLRAALLTGHLSVEAHAREEEQLEGLLAERAALDGNEHLQEYLAVWRELRAPRLLVPMA